MRPIGLFSRLLGHEEIEQLYHEHAKVLVLFACAMVGERTRAQDIVQQVFLRLVERPVERPDNPRAYLFAAVHNNARNQMRSLRRMVELGEKRGSQFPPCFEVPGCFWLPERVTQEPWSDSSGVFEIFN